MNCWLNGFPMPNELAGCAREVRHEVMAEDQAAAWHKFSEDHQRYIREQQEHEQYQDHLAFLMRMWGARGLPNRLTRVLAEACLDGLTAVAARSDKELMKLPNVGRKSVRAFRAYVTANPGVFVKEQD